MSQAEMESRNRLDRPVDEGYDHILGLSNAEITLVECDRVMVRAWALGGLDGAAAEQRARTLAKAAARWVLLHLDSDVLARARQPFPIEPVNIAASSLRMSPNRFDATTTSKLCGRRTKFIAAASTSSDSVAISG